MKKIYALMAVAVAALGLTSCNDDTDPKYKAPTNFTLNTPALADQYYELTEDGTLVFTCSQPDYGFTASTTYGIQIALSEGGDTYTIAPQTPTSATIRVKASDVATGMCVLRGIESEDDWTQPGFIPVYVRATAQLGTHGKSYIESNWIELKHVEGYFALPQPGCIYLVGSPCGWPEPSEANAGALADWRIFEKSDNIGSKVYYGVFDMPAAPMFRFYTALTGWDTDSYGSQVDDAALDFELGDDGSLTETLVKGKGSFNFPNFAGGEMTIIVDMNTLKVTFLEGDQL
ncbi:MAG: SusE domain-containing protein [Bacteroidales bacterium]|nr:SusE domain-containing protein [Bacteroidales bacterium]